MPWAKLQAVSTLFRPPGEIEETERELLQRLGRAKLGTLHAANESGAGEKQLARAAAKLMVMGLIP